MPVVYHNRACSALVHAVHANAAEPARERRGMAYDTASGRGKMREVACVCMCAACKERTAPEV